jgi:hypothetical protein
MTAVDAVDAAQKAAPNDDDLKRLAKRVKAMSS